MWKLTLGYGRRKTTPKKMRKMTGGGGGGLQGARKHMGVPRRTTRAPISKPRDDINDGKHARALGSPLGNIVKDAKCTTKR
jgi:hypothetical protein